MTNHQNKHVVASQVKKERALAPHNLGMLKVGSPCPYLLPDTSVNSSLFYPSTRLVWERAGAVHEGKEVEERDGFSLWMSQTFGVTPTCRKI